MRASLRPNSFTLSPPDPPTDGVQLTQASTHENLRQSQPHCRFHNPRSSTSHSDGYTLPRAPPWYDHRRSCSGMGIDKWIPRHLAERDGVFASAPTAFHILASLPYSRPRSRGGVVLPLIPFQRGAHQPLCNTCVGCCSHMRLSRSGRRMHAPERSMSTGTTVFERCSMPAKPAVIG